MSKQITITVPDGYEEPTFVLLVVKDEQVVLRTTKATYAGAYVVPGDREEELGDYDAALGLLLKDFGQIIRTGVITVKCKHCGQDIEYMQGTGWVETRSGDEGGTYDICEENAAWINGDLVSKHEPKGR